MKFLISLFAIILLGVGSSTIVSSSAIETSPSKLVFHYYSDISELSDEIMMHGVAKPGQFPWHVLLVEKNANMTNSYCGGAILNERWIITSADCVSDARDIRVDVGSIDARKPMMSVYPESVKIHPQYARHFYHNNIALLRLPIDKPLVFPNELKPAFRSVRLPRWSQRFQRFVNQMGYYTGFGSTDDGKQNVTETLLYVEEKIISNSECLEFYANSTDFITDEVLCLQGKRQGPCDGDGGDPLVINENGEWTLVGILSFFHKFDKCGRQPSATTFTRITPYLEWIAQTTNYQLRP